MTCTVRACIISVTQRIPRGPVLRPSWTVREHLTRGETAAHKLRAKSLMEQPASQLSSQNKALVPSPTTTETVASKNAYVAQSTGNRNVTHVLSGSVRASHRHRRRRAIPKVQRSGRPRPPKWVGQATFTQATRQRPLLATFVPHQRKPRMRVSIALIAQGAMEIAIETCTGIAERVDLARTKRPPQFSSLPCQGRRLTTLSTSGCKAALGILLVERGTPR
jgi:hypothetical protein